MAVLAVRLDENNMYTAPLERFKIKALYTIHDIPEISGLGYHWEAFIKEEESYDDDFNTRLSDIYDISYKTDAEGNLSWEAPEGRFRIFRFVYTGTGLQVSSSDTEGLTMDFISAEAMDVHFDHSATVLLKDMQGKHCDSWKYLQDNCWEPDAANWTESRVGPGGWSAAPCTGPAGRRRRPPGRRGRRRRATRPGSAGGPRRSRSTRSAGRPPDGKRRLRRCDGFF